jgi:peptidoglycan/xylan/chitin deacetylase (PgdA/CDA1 family)
MMSPQNRIMLSIDLEEWYHSRRWVDGAQSREIPDSRAICRGMYGTDRPRGDVVAPTRRLLALLDQHGVRVTAFVLGEMAEFYPDLVREIAARGHEIASHGYAHADMTLLGPERFNDGIARTNEILEVLTGRRPIGYRAPNLVYEPWATRILEAQGILYDASVCRSRPLGGKYKGLVHAPLTPYHPSYEDIARRGNATLVEVPLPSFPVIKVAAGSSITTRVFGYHWSRIALAAALRHGTTSYYVHPWELGARPATVGHRVRNLVFLRHTGDWMYTALDRLLRAFPGRFITGRQALEIHLATTSRTGAQQTPAVLTR